MAEVDSRQPAAPDPSVSPPPLEGDALLAALRQQLEWYFSRANLANDTYLVSKMNDSKWVDIDVIANFKKLKTLLAMAGSADDARALLLEVIKLCDNCEADESGLLVRPKTPLKHERCTLILRDIPNNTPLEEVRAIFDFDGCEKPEQISAEAEDNWFVRFESQDACLRAMLALADRQFQGKPIRARVKTELSRHSMDPGRYHPPNFDTMNGFSFVPAYGAPYPYTQGYPGWQGMAPPQNFRQTPRNQNSSRGAKGGALPKKSKQGNPRASQAPGSGSGRGRGPKVNKSAQQPQKPPEEKKAEVDPQLEFSNDQFPGLPTKAEQGGYKAPFQTYSREQMADIVALTVATKFARPGEMPASEAIVRDTPLTDCQLLEPFPIMFPGSPSPTAAPAEPPPQQNIPALDLANTPNRAAPAQQDKPKRGSRGQTNTEKPRYATKGKKVRKPQQENVAPPIENKGEAPGANAPNVGQVAAAPPSPPSPAKTAGARPQTNKPNIQKDQREQKEGGDAGAPVARDSSNNERKKAVGPVKPKGGGKGSRGNRPRKDTGDRSNPKTNQEPVAPTNAEGVGQVEKAL